MSEELVHTEISQANRLDAASEILQQGLNVRSRRTEEGNLDAAEEELKRSLIDAAHTLGMSPSDLEKPLPSHQETDDEIEVAGLA